jgi:hypothetical protein
MGIINLQTNLKSLTYGGEKPYITKNINNPPPSNGLAMQVNRRIDDVSRITQMLADKPGVKYLINNTLLHGSRLEHKLNDEKKKVDQASPSTIVLGELKSAGLDTISTIGSTLAQVAVNGTGTHFVKGFGQGISSYIGDKDAGSLAYYGSPINIPSNQPSTLVSGQGGNLKIARNSQSTVYNPYDSDSVGQLLQGQYNTSNNNYYDGSTYNNTKRISLTVNGSIRKETRVNLGDQGARKDPDKTANNYWKASVGAKDSINALPVQINNKVQGTTEGRDLVKFRFHVVTPENEYVLYFRAYLDSFTDNYNGNWSENKYLGRGESFYTYGGFQRKISLSFKIAAATREEMMPLYQKMIYLASSTAPTYGGNGQFMRGTITKITVGDYVYELPGVMNSVTYTWNQDYPWEIAMTEPEGLGDKTMQELPMVMDCNIEFTPIHTFTPTAGFNRYITAKGNNGLDTPGVLIPEEVDKDLPNPTSGDIAMGPQSSKTRSNTMDA